MGIYTIEEINEKYSNFGLKAFEKFSKDVIEEVKSLNTDLSKENLFLYENHTDKKVITIDGEKTLDIDDAIFVEKTGKLYSLTVYIADVSHYVKAGSKLDEDALKRGTSIYLPNKTLSMFPNKLCNDICSLKENKERLTIAINMIYDKKGKLQHKRIFKAIISSKKKMTYDKVNKVLKKSDEDVTLEYKDFISELFLMEELALILRKRREKKHFLELNIPEFDFYIPSSLEFDNISMIPYKKTIASVIIEEFMLAANFNIAKTFYELEIPFIYRTHGMPVLSNIDFKLKINYKKIFKSSKYLVKIISKKLNKAKKNKKIILSYNVLNSLTSAKYSPNATGHFALNTKYYCHFTSPIRRYPDLFIHRIISEYLEKGSISNEMLNEYNDLATQVAKKCSDAENFAKKVSRELENMYTAFYMQDFIGENFKASIFKLSKKHISIYIKDVFVTGKIAISSISSKTNREPIHYQNQIIIDENNILKIFDDLTVTLVDIDKSTNCLMFELA